MTKDQWLNQMIMFDEKGNPPSLNNVPLRYGLKKESFELKKYSEKKIEKLYQAFIGKDRE